MRKIFVIALIGLISHSIFAQDSIQKPTVLLRPYFENGIDFIRNDFLKQNYETQSKYFWGLGVQFGYPETQSLIPYAQFTSSSFEIENEIAPDIKADSVLTNKQVSGGLIIPLIKMNDAYFRMRMGYCYSMIKESFSNIDSNSHGFQIGVGFERKVIGNSKIFLDLTYNYQKTGESNFRDFDMTKLSVGFIL
jgi:opacity protein-like surface antigen